MSKLRFRISMSLDGFVAGPSQSVDNPLGIGGMRLHQWAFPLEVWRSMQGLPGGEVNESTSVVEESLANIGASVMGRNMFGGHPGPWNACSFSMRSRGDLTAGSRLYSGVAITLQTAHHLHPQLRLMFNGQPDRAIDVIGVGKRFGIRWVLRGVSLEVRRGEAVGLLGPNGSGKSTVLRILGTLLNPNAGSGSVNGFDIVRDPSSVRGQVGYLAHIPGLYDDLTARENLWFAADMLGLPHTAVEGSLERVGLAHVAGDRVRGFSAGMQRRLALARLILRNPRVLLLDEPYSNLDSEGVELMNSMIAGIVRSGGAALVALHELAPAKAVLDRTLTLAQGRIEGAR